MRLLKLIVISAVVLFALTTCISLLLPNKVLVSRATNINANIDSVYSYTNNLKSWQSWVYGLNNFSINNNAINTGNTTITITSFTKEKQPNKITAKVIGKWIERNGNTQNFELNLFATNSATTVVQWQFEQQLQWYPWQKFASIINDKVIGSILETNLANLKTVCEK